MPDKTQGGRESFRLLYPPHTRTRAASLPDSSFFHTLQIDQMVSVRRESWRGLPDLRLEQFFTTDTDVLAWRLDVVADLVESEALRSLIKDALPMLRDAAEMRKVLNSSSSTVESSLASVRYLEVYLELVELFHARLAAAPIRSAGFAALRDEVEKRRQSESYRALTAQLEKTQYQIGHVKSIALGVNLDGTLRVTDVGLLGLNTEKYRQGSVLDKLLGIKDLRTDKRIDFVGGIRGLDELSRRVDSGEMKVAFALYPVSMGQLINMNISNRIIVCITYSFTQFLMIANQPFKKSSIFL